ncbi:RimK family alpha-L-glutamate ligase [Candidatus Uhrbacteria bacterium]|nr:MAG: RimK family alpha-L-glutamate ligase [Candidatus Uhrbacteria bacterium]
MKLGILISSEPRGETATGSAGFERAAAERGMACERLYAPSFSFHVEGDALAVRYEGKAFGGYDALVYRPNFVEEPSLHAYVPALLIRAGVRVVNGQADVAATKNKLAQHVSFLEHGIPAPRFAIVKRVEDARRAAEEIGYPVVAKTPFGTHGIGVFYAPDVETLAPVIDYLGVSDGNPVILERFVAEAHRKDLRAFVLGGRVVASMERTAPEGDIRANASQGGTGRAVELTDEETALAVRVAELFRCEIAGVDLLRSKEGPLVIEANANPGFAELERATGKDIAGAIIEYAVGLTADKREKP